ncbi:DUF86 domain-containing protein [Salirhabdus salicampi]|uniref:DUF86 domain-containing protein n=1 Tax=Salirhabdus salicampi TaxID=476102 RepID=UPI0020C53215|nr:DUF86 domain-containing protein [Salirhabdus salicampi]MCP8617752.1 DUF86 domain-containing protein [Salirhabdus salicampi]
MYFVNRDKLEKTLLYIDAILQQFPDLQNDTFLHKLSLERIVQNTIEGIIDVGNMMIDGFIMRDPGSYEDIIDILIDEKVLPHESKSAYKELIRLRKMLVRNYIDIDHEQLTKVMLEHLPKIEQFSQQIRRYLDEEPGPVSAFSNSNEK